MELGDDVVEFEPLLAAAVRGAYTDRGAVLGVAACTGDAAVDAGSAGDGEAAGAVSSGSACCEIGDPVEVDPDGGEDFAFREREDERAVEPLASSLEVALPIAWTAPVARMSIGMSLLTFAE